MEVQVQEDCKVHNKFQSFKCFDCNIFICPNCLKDHPHKKKLIRTEVTGHFLSYVDNIDYECDYPGTIWTYNLSKSLLEYKDYESEPYNQESIYVQYVVYLSGGLRSMSEESLNEPFDDFRAYDTRTKGNIVEKRNMITKLAFNALCTTNDLDIYSIGGKNDNGYLNIWKSLKPITSARGNVSLGVWNCQIIYCIGGCNPEFSEIIETLDTGSEGNAWNVVKIIDRGKFDPRSSMMIVQNPIENNIMIFGGCCEAGVTKDIFIYDIEKGTIKLRPGLNLMKYAAFIQRRPAFWDNSYYLFEYGRMAGIYKYSLKDKTVTRIKAKTYLGEKLWRERIKLL